MLNADMLYDFTFWTRSVCYSRVDLLRLRMKNELILKAVHAWR